ncbi:hypothetical protein P609_15280 [Comamonas thiooxydans]|nr:hypothetical protein P609_15280 [Comamonas thiooxydans]
MQNLKNFGRSMKISNPRKNDIYIMPNIIENITN